MIELGEIVPAGPLAEVNKPNQALGGMEDEETNEMPYVTNRVRSGKGAPG